MISKIGDKQIFVHRKNDPDVVGVMASDHVLTYPLEVIKAYASKGVTLAPFKGVVLVMWLDTRDIEYVDPSELTWLDEDEVDFDGEPDPDGGEEVEEDEQEGAA